MSVLVAVFPPPAPPAGVCQACRGLGLSGERYRFPGSDPLLLVDGLCPKCLGCGRADHDDECAAPEHPPDPFEWGPWNDEDGETDGPSCYSCRGHGWFEIQGWQTSGDDEVVGDGVVTLRVPCGCIPDERMRSVPDPDEMT